VTTKDYLVFEDLVKTWDDPVFSSIFYLAQHPRNWDVSTSSALSGPPQLHFPKDHRIFATPSALWTRPPYHDQCWTSWMIFSLSAPDRD
jgi:hypothetical protein